MSRPSPTPVPTLNPSPPSLSLKVCVCGCYSAAVSMSRPSPTPVPTLNPSPPSLSLKVCVGATWKLIESPENAVPGSRKYACVWKWPQDFVSVFEMTLWSCLEMTLGFLGPEMLSLAVKTEFTVVCVWKWPSKCVWKWPPCQRVLAWDKSSTKIEPFLNHVLIQIEFQSLNLFCFFSIGHRTIDIRYQYRTRPGSFKSRTYRRGWLLWVTDGRVKTPMDRVVVKVSSLFVSFFQSLCLPISLYLYVFLSHLITFLSIHPSIHPSIHRSIYLSVYLSIYPSIYVPMYLSLSIYIYLIRPSIKLSSWLSIYLPT